MSYRTLFLTIGIVGLMLSGCGSDGKDGAPGAQGPEGPPGPSYGTPTSLSITIDSVTIGSPAKPVVNFTVKNQDGQPFAGLGENDLRYGIAKLMPSVNGNPTVWQNYIFFALPFAFTGWQERSGSLGTLVNHSDGTYTYTFVTDLNKAQAACDATGACTDADGNALDLSYQPTYTHRVSVQQVNHDLPLIIGFKDFVPAGGTVTTMRDIVKTSNCNECHNYLQNHGAYYNDTKICVTCHNPGSTIYGTPNETLDFKVLIHKFHYSGPDMGAPGNPGLHQPNYLGEEIGFPQDIRNCTKCHTDDDSDPNRNAPQGNNWKTNPSMEACGSCHDDIYFGSAPPDPTNKPWQNVSHPGEGKDPIVPVGNGACTFCHSPSEVASAHTVPRWQNQENYELVINDVRGDGLTGPSFLEIDISAINPNTGVAYDLAGDGAFTGSHADMNIHVAWSRSESGANTDYNNAGSTPITGVGYAQDNQPENFLPRRVDIINGGVLEGNNCDGTTTFTDRSGGNWICDVDTATHIYTFTMQSALPAGAVGTGAVAFEGHPAQPDDSERMYVKSVVSYFPITDTEAIPRRKVVDIDNCNKCHRQLALHGGNRVDEPELCVMCHNPNVTEIFSSSAWDAGDACRPAGDPDPADWPDDYARPKKTDDDTATGQVLYALDSCYDGQTEQPIHFKVLIHGIHGTHLREESGKAIQIGNDILDIHYPGILSDCETCHADDTYVLEGALEAPALNGLQSTSTEATPAATTSNADPIVYGNSLNDQDDDLKTSPTAAACAACHNGATVKTHMTDLGGAVFGTKTQQEITDDATFGITMETCSVCHGPGAIADVEAMHDAATAATKQGLE